MATIDKFYPILREKEGGFVHDPDDAGGATNMGITLSTYTAYCRHKGYPCPTVERLKNLTSDQWEDIIRLMYWDACRADDIQSQSVAMLMVDWAVHSGTSTAIKHVQRILDVKADGIVGPVTLASINSYSPLPLFGQIKQARIKFLGSLAVNRPQNRKFINGWLRRVNSINYEE